MPDISHKEFKLFANLIYAKSGIFLSEIKKELVKSRLQKRMVLHGITGFREYYDLIIKDKSGNELLMMLDAITTNKTDFFRESEHFIFLKKHMFPQVLKQKGSINIWCAGCSSGEEPYTAAMVLMESVPEYKNYNIKILATDLSPNILDAAKKGIYSSSQMVGVPPLFAKKYFNVDKKNKNNAIYSVKPEVKKHIYFRWLNLMSNNYPFTAKFDLIFCRNVLIYFDQQSQQSVINQFYNYLNPKGYLLIGHSESLNKVDSRFAYVEPATYQKG